MGPAAHLCTAPMEASVASAFCWRHLDGGRRCAGNERSSIVSEEITGLARGLEQQYY